MESPDQILKLTFILLLLTSIVKGISEMKKNSRESHTAVYGYHLYKVKSQ